MAEELRPLLFPGQKAEWTVLGPPTDEDIRNSWVVRTVLRTLPDFTENEAGRGILCGGPGCERVLKAGERVVLLTNAERSFLMQVWFCSMECERKCHAVVSFIREEDRTPGEIARH